MSRVFLLTTCFFVLVAYSAVCTLYVEIPSLIKEIDDLKLSILEQTQKLSEISEEISKTKQKRFENTQKIADLSQKIDKHALKRSALKKDQHAYVSLAIRMSKTPPQLFLGLTQSNHQMILGLEYLRSIFTTLQKKAWKYKKVKQSLQSEHLMLTKNAQELAREEDRMCEVEKGVQLQKQETEKTLSQKEKLLMEETQRLEKLKQNKLSVKSILAAIPVQSQVTEGAAIAKRDFLFPVSGHILTHFGQEDIQGHRSHGLYIDVPHHSEVKAPLDGKVAFCGPFRHYSNIVIIDHNQGYHSLLMGFNTVSVKVGDQVKKGQNLGSAGLGLFFLELRHLLQPIDPSPWFANLK